jgi:hypothetical protein
MVKFVEHDARDGCEEFIVFARVVPVSQFVFVKYHAPHETPKSTNTLRVFVQCSLRR